MNGPEFDLFYGKADFHYFTGTLSRFKKLLLKSSYSDDGATFKFVCGQDVVRFNDITSEMQLLEKIENYFRKKKLEAL